MGDRTIHIPGICRLPFHPLPPAAFSAASNQPGTLTVFHWAWVSQPLPLWSPAAFLGRKLPV